MSVTTPIIPRIQKTRSLAYPQFEFEWHESQGKVYLLAIPGTWYEDRQFIPAATGTINAVCIAEHCDTHGRFLGFVQTYLRGYRAGMADGKEREASCG